MGGASSAGTASPGTSVGGAGSLAGGSGGGGGGSVSGGGGGGSGSTGLPHRVLLAAPDEFVQAHAVHLDDLVSDARDVAVRPAPAAADPFHEDLVVLVHATGLALAE